MLFSEHSKDKELLVDSLLYEPGVYEQDGTVMLAPDVIQSLSQWSGYNSDILTLWHWAPPRWESNQYSFNTKSFYSALILCNKTEHLTLTAA